MIVKRSSQKAAAMVEEEEGSSDVGCGCAATSWLRVAWSQQGYGCNRRKTGQRCARLLRRRTAMIRSERPLLVMFNSLLAMIKTIGSEILLWLRCRQITTKDHYWQLFCRKESLMAMIKEDASERSLLAALCSKGCVLRLKG
ncbi:hypothetical protein GW17_00056130 [Ensete ventricosum]|uniref:Uncharacterized protein n=1 Tax=Ensete ventricosum TaxID=4639 RepID=A0A444C917_ENSVE|nr:hypothetical protein GW17_00056130 [Ensete ventricosum]RZR73239.1 hypothetical protein BHM03_00021788 [Ensete ventricosum]